MVSFAARLGARALARAGAQPTTLRAVQPATVAPIAPAAAAARCLSSAAATPAALPERRSVERHAFRTVDLTLPNGETLQLHPIWLRDHCQCPSCYHSITQQRLLDTYQIPVDLQARTVAMSETDDNVDIAWSDGHKSRYSLALLKQVHQPQRREPDIFQQRTLWETAQVANDPPSVDYRKVMDTEEGVLEWLLKIARWGFCIVRGVPATPKDTEELAKRITFIRPSIFGGFWDFQPNLEHADTAYTTMALGVHTDTTYFTDPVGLQMFHLIEFTGEGGQTTLVDAFRVAEEMRQHHPMDFETLCNTSIPSQYLDRSGKIELRPIQAYPIFVRDPTAAPDQPAPLQMVRYNNDDRAPLLGMSLEQVDAFYRAHRKFNQLIRSPTFEYRFQMTAGNVVIFDNQRLLHGRTAFRGHRRLVGCYLNGDDYRSRLRGLLYERDHGLSRADTEPSDAPQPSH